MVYMGDPVVGRDTHGKIGPARLLMHTAVCCGIIVGFPCFYDPPLYRVSGMAPFDAPRLWS